MITKRIVNGKENKTIYITKHKGKNTKPHQNTNITNINTIRHNHNKTETNLNINITKYIHNETIRIAYPLFINHT